MGSDSRYSGLFNEFEKLENKAFQVLGASIKSVGFRVLRLTM